METFQIWQDENLEIREVQGTQTGYTQNNHAQSHLIKLSKTKGTNLKEVTHQSTKRTANIGLIYQVKTSYRNDGESRTPSHAGTLEILLPDLSLKEQTNKIK